MKFIYLLFLGLGLTGFENTNAAFSSDLLACKDDSSLLSKTKLLFQSPTSPEAKNWIESQRNKLEPFEAPSEFVSSLRARRLFYSTGLAALPRIFKHGEWISGPEQQLILKQADGSQNVVIAPKSFHPNATISDILLSPDESRVALSLVVEGGDVKFWYLYDFQTRTFDSPDPIRVRFEGVSWTLDSRGVFYSVWPSEQQENTNISNGTVPRVPVALHTFGEARTKDTIILQHDANQPGELLGVVELIARKTVLAIRYPKWVSLPEHYRVGTFNSDGRSVTWGEWNYNPDVRVKFVDSESGAAYFISTVAGNNSGVAKWTLLKGKLLKRIVVAADKKLVLSNVARHRGLFLLTYVTPNLSTVLRLADGSGKIIREITSEEIGMPSVGTFSWNSDSRTNTSVYFTFSSPKFGPRRFQLDLKTLKIAMTTQPSFFPKAYHQLQEGSSNAKSADGTNVPIYFVKRKDQQPAFVYMLYYGALAMISTPSFSHLTGTILEMGGAIAIVNPRGSGALGLKGFREGGKNKLKTIADLAAAGNWLKKNLQPVQGRLVGHGGSWGGLHTYQLAIFYPSLFDVLISYIPVSSMELNHPGHLGWALLDDIFFNRDRSGFLVHFNQQLSKTIKQWDPFQRIPCAKSIPTILTLGSIRDQRTGPSQHFVFTHALQSKFGSNANAFLSIDEKNLWGHGTSANQELRSLGFLAKRYGITTIKELIPE